MKTGLNINSMRIYAMRIYAIYASMCIYALICIYASSLLALSALLLCLWIRLSQHYDARLKNHVLPRRPPSVVRSVIVIDNKAMAMTPFGSLDWRASVTAKVQRRRRKKKRGE